jgi:hypothetical protein
LKAPRKSPSSSCGRCTGRTRLVRLPRSLRRASLVGKTAGHEEAHHALQGQARATNKGTRAGSSARQGLGEGQGANDWTRPTESCSRQKEERRLGSLSVSPHLDTKKRTMHCRDKRERQTKEPERDPRPDKEDDQGPRRGIDPLQARLTWAKVREQMTGPGRLKAAADRRRKAHHALQGQARATNKGTRAGSSARQGGRPRMPYARD